MALEFYNFENFDGYFVKIRVWGKVKQYARLETILEFSLFALLSSLLHTSPHSVICSLLRKILYWVACRILYVCP